MHLKATLVFKEISRSARALQRNLVLKNKQSGVRLVMQLCGRDLKQLKKEGKVLIIELSRPTASSEVIVG